MCLYTHVIFSCYYLFGYKVMPLFLCNFPTHARMFDYTRFLLLYHTFCRCRVVPTIFYHTYILYFSFLCPRVAYMMVCYLYHYWDITYMTCYRSCFSCWIFPCVCMHTTCFNLSTIVPKLLHFLALACICVSTCSVPARHALMHCNCTTINRIFVFSISA